MLRTRMMRVGAAASFVAAGLLAVLFVLSYSLGSDLILLERSLDVEPITNFIRLNADALQTTMMLDDAFVIAYTLAFAGLATYLWNRSRLAALLGLAFALLTTATDFVENSVTLATVALVAAQGAMNLELLIALNVLAQLKFLWVNVAVILFAAAVWDKRRLNRVTAILFLIFPALGVVAIASIGFGLLRVFWMLVVLIAGGVLLWREAATAAP